ncbi:putative extracellular elastinolytic metalloproteinase precursor [Moniliophthora roreri MCA 2997]|uniref:Extracellular metalloproteinase n=1 Tax=Moniliophthora roreri (strain MCA 2997) TaxID=1381753 RepID=V2WWE1_MONRO|nr:putative extracellular elastinolytic metalloproteinase precursor [Moniliophthora roreri MCA 2997]
MASFKKILTSVLLAIVYASSTDAKLSTHQVRTVGRRALKIESYHPPTTFKTFGKVKTEKRAVDVDINVEVSSVDFVKSELNLDDSKFSYTTGYTSEGWAYGYLKQQHNGIPFANAVANVAFKDTQLISFGNSFVDASNIADSTPTFDIQQAIRVAEDALEGKHNDIEPTLEYLVRPDGSVALTHVIQIKNDDARTWYEAFVDAHSGELLSITDFVAHATYKVIPVQKPSLLAGYETLVDPQDLSASPLGWHNDGTGLSNTTLGNNVLAFKATRSAVTTQSADGLVFDYEYDDSLTPVEGDNVDASRTQAFYLGNKVHDIMYKYGFTEAAYNFQNTNFGKGGREHDRLLMFVQHSRGVNNSNIAVPPDGQSPECHMFLFTYTTPSRDAIFDISIPVHEITHGLTQRITGGGTARCLQTMEAGGLGEGWSDAFADWTEHQSGPDIKDFALGAYVLNRSRGARDHHYSTNPMVNPLRYSSIKSGGGVHKIGQAWANILHNVYAALVTEHGWSSTAFTDPTGLEGNVVYLHLFVDALAIQPCNPTFLSARDSWIQADEARYSGAHKCLLWKTFASRGLGVKAANYRDGRTIPKECQVNVNVNVTIDLEDQQSPIKI